MRVVTRAVGIRQVAEAANVSITTVSHVLNDVDGARVSTETRQRVHAAAQRLGYKPNRLARGLRMQSSGTLGLISDNIATTPHAGRLILGAQEAALRHGFTLVLFNTDHDPQVEDRDLRTLLEFQVDGVIYATMYHRVVTPPPVLLTIPTVLLDAEPPPRPPRSRRMPQLPSVVPDEVQGGRAVMDELLAHGHRNIGFLTNVDDVPATHGRLRAYRECLQEAGVPFRPELVVAEPSEAYGGHRAAHRLLAGPDRPTALFCYNDRMAMGAYRAAAELGLRIPGDLSIVGFDNQEPIAENLYPGLTTVALPHYEMGAWAVETLTALISGRTDAADPSGAPLLMPCPLIRRESVGAPTTTADRARRG